jgi:hypothetical protein
VEAFRKFLDLRSGFYVGIRRGFIVRDNINPPKTKVNSHVAPGSTIVRPGDLRAAAIANFSNNEVTPLTKKVVH